MSICRPSVFVASSKEAIRIVEAIQVNLDNSCEVVPWTAVFTPGQFALESLSNRIDDFDFAIILLTGDDSVISRGRRSIAPRDNLMLELGLCFGRLGQRRTFMLTDRSNSLKLPTDLDGITRVTFHPPNTGNYQSALGAACATLRATFDELGRRPRLANLKVGGQELVCSLE